MDLLAARFPLARHAVSSLGLAALAVSAALLTRSPAVAVEIDAGTREAPASPWTAMIRDLTVVGSPDADAMAWAIAPLATAFADCAASGARVTIYAHFEGGIITTSDAYGTDTAANQCAMHAIDRLSVPVLDVMDVMIPIDFAPAM
jgi:hypothetical protein